MERRTIKFKLLGGIRFSEGECGQWSSLDALPVNGVGKKQLAFLTYFLLNHQREITSEELIQHFWSNESRNPASALKNTLHKVRVLLKIMFPDCDEFIITKHGGYVWSEELILELDVEHLERLYRSTKHAPDEKRIALELEAFELYDGEILPGSSLDWLDHLNTYYRNIYIDLCKSLVTLLQEEERWDEVIRVCKETYAVAPEFEVFSTGFMQALIATGMPELAIRHYETYRSMLWQEYSLIPSDRIEQIYSLAVECNSNTENYEQELLRQMTQMSESLKAFQCSLLVFRNLVHLELRNMLRNNSQSSIVVLSVGKQNPNQPPSTDIRRMERTLLYSLRAGDPFARLSLGSFALLLPGASEENAQKVVERICREFYNTYPRSQAALNYHIYPLTTETEIETEASKR